MTMGGEGGVEGAGPYIYIYIFFILFFLSVYSPHYLIEKTSTPGRDVDKNSGKLLFSTEGPFYLTCSPITSRILHCFLQKKIPAELL